MVVIGAICQGKTKGSASRNRRKPPPRRACPTPHHPPSRGRNYRIRAWSDCGENGQAGASCERIISTEPCFAHSTRTEWLRRQSRALVESFAPGRRGIDPAKLLVLPI